ncbi:MAG: hypothetical protein ACREQK_08875 [Candidatus Binatia bacterium]|jgi:hypothetical protein
MKDFIKILDAEYGFKLSEEEIEIIAKQAEASRRLFQPLHDLNLPETAPIMKIDKKVKK